MYPAPPTIRIDTGSVYIEEGLVPARIVDARQTRTACAVAVTVPIVPLLIAVAVAPPPPAAPPATSAPAAVVPVVRPAAPLLMMAAAAVAVAVTGRLVALTAAALIGPRRQDGQRDRRAGPPLDVGPDVGVANRRPAGREILVGDWLAAARGHRSLGAPFEIGRVDYGVAGQRVARARVAPGPQPLVEGLLAVGWRRNLPRRQRRRNVARDRGLEDDR